MSEHEEYMPSNIIENTISIQKDKVQKTTVKNETDKKKT
jgi:hypothetical protein